MSPDKEWYAQVDEEGRLILPSEVASRYRIKPGVRVHLDENANGLRVRRPATQLAKLYVEPTNQCNLDCRTCIRNVWDEPSGMMSDAVIARVMEGLRAFSPRPTVFFGGFGEPLFHRKIVEMVAQAKSLGASVELITNGTRLTEDLSRDLIVAGLDVLWVSLDGATPESYADVRLGAALPQVIENVKCFRNARRALNRRVVQIGVAFVAMKRNVADLPDILRLGRDIGASRFVVTNLLPYTDEMQKEVLYCRVLSESSSPPSVWVPHLSLPKMDANKITRESLYRLMSSTTDVTWADRNMRGTENRCPFVESGAGAIGWDGRFSPCLPLLYSHVSFRDDRERFSRRWVIGNVTERNLPDLWNAPEHIAFRERVQVFDFSPCTICGGCDLSQANEEDCFGNTFPTCGGCLWAQGVIQCP